MSEVRRVDLDVSSIVLHIGMQNTRLDKETSMNKFGGHVSINLLPCFQVNNHTTVSY
jgi:hypothetical protein